MNNTVFVESQGFVTKWLIVLFIFLLSIEGHTIYTVFVDTGVFSFGVGFWILLVVFLALFFIRLKTRIDDQGIQIQFFPFVIRKRWKWEDIGAIYMTEYSLRDYGGWGYRFSAKGIAYTTKGKNGIQIILKNGQKRLIGTQHPDQAASIIAMYKITDDDE